MTVEMASVDRTEVHGADDLAAIPRWLQWIDGAAIAVLNISLIGQVLLIFAATILRSYTNSPLVVGVAETAHPFLVTISFWAAPFPTAAVISSPSPSCRTGCRHM